METEYAHNKVTGQVAIIFDDSGAVVFASISACQKFVDDSQEYLDSITVRIPGAFIKAFEKEEA